MEVAPSLQAEQVSRLVGGMTPFWRSSARAGMLFVALFRAEDDAIALQVGQLLSRVLGRHHDQAHLCCLAVFPRESGDMRKGAARFLDVGFDHGLLANHDIGFAIGLGPQGLEQRFVEGHAYRPIRQLLEVLPKLLVVTLGITFDAWARQG